MKAYLSGCEADQGWHLLRRSLPQLFSKFGLRDAFLPVDIAGVLFQALKDSVKDLCRARIVVERLGRDRVDENPLWRASQAVRDQILRASNYRRDSEWHLEQHCLKASPFLRFVKAPDAATAEDVQRRWAHDLLQLHKAAKAQGLPGWNL
jgi:hypothetical protein